MIPELNPSPRTLMGPGPVEVDPRVLRAMSCPVLGQFDPEFTGLMTETTGLLRQVFRTRNRQAYAIDGSSRAGLEAVLVSILEPGDRVLVPIHGRFGHLLCEIAERCGGEVRSLEVEWGTVVEPDQVRRALDAFPARVVAMVHGETSTGQLQPLAEIGRLCREREALLVVDVVASIGGAPVDTDGWCIDACIAGLQKCLSGPPGCAPITYNERVEALVARRRSVERGLAGGESANPRRIRSNYFDLAMLQDYWGPLRLNHHTEATSMLYALRETLRCVLLEGLDQRVARHELHARALRAGLAAMGLKLFGGDTHRMPSLTPVLVPDGVDEARLREQMLHDFGIEIGAAFGPLRGRIWRIGTMGYSAQKRNVLFCLGALATCLRAQGYRCPSAEGVDAALAVYRATE